MGSTDNQVVRLALEHCIRIFTMTKPLHCPICKKLVPLDSPEVPFCSERCRTIDLGKWASGEYKISSPILDPDVLESLQNEQARTELQDTPTKEWKN